MTQGAAAAEPTAAVPPPEIYRSLFLAYPDALLLVDDQGRIVLANPQAARLLGYVEDRLVGLSVDELVPSTIRPQHAAYRHAYAQQPRARPMGTQMELVARRGDGTEVMVEIALSPLRDSGLPYVVAAVRGIDSYPRVQQALRRARYSECLAQLARLAVDEPNLQAMLERVPAAVAEVVQADTAALLLLEPGQRDFRLAAGAHLLPGEAAQDRVPNTPDSAAGYAAQAGVAVAVPDLAGETRFVVSQPLLDAGLQSGLLVPLIDRAQVMGVLTLHCRRPRPFAADEMQFLESIASLLANRLQRARSEEALEHVQRLETVGQLTGGIAHDFNNLLTIIQGNLQVLEDRPSVQQDEVATDCVATAMRASQRSAELTAKLLAFSRRQALSPRRLDVATLLHELAGMLRRTLDRSIDVRLQAEPLHCVADPAQLESAVLNLAVNARDAMPAGGVLRLSCMPLAEPSADLADELAAGLAQGWRYAAIEVSDTGTGMPAEVQERAFEPFFTTKALGRGTGLGLSSVFGFVKQSLGAVRLRSAPGQGTTVMLVLPGAQEPAVPRALDNSLGAAAEQPLPAGLHVLLVEDEDEVRQTVCNTLMAIGCRVTGVGSAEQALVHLGQHAAPDVLLSDVALGAGMPGTELAQHVRARWPSVGRVLMSGYMHDASRAAGADDTHEELLRKPFDRTALLGALHRALAAAAVNAGPPKAPPAG
jgi:PAS domain S-box-containing protein